MNSDFFEPGHLHDAEFPEPSFLVEPLVPARSIILLHGPPGSGKTQLALTLGIALANGQPFLGQFPTVKSRVLIVEVDMPRKMLQLRAQQAPATRALSFLHSDPFDVETVAIKPPESFVQARNWKPDLVIVDTLRKTTLLDENDSSTPMRVYSAWRRLFPESAIAVVHHDRKMSTMPGAAIKPEEAARGSIAWSGDADGCLQLSKLRGHKLGGHVATLTITKARYMNEPEPLQVRMTPELLLEPVGQNAVSVLLAFLSNNPGATQSDAASILVGSKVCSRATAYRLIAKYASQLVSPENVVSQA